MRAVAIFCILLSTVAGGASAGPAATEYERQVSGRLVIAADGHVQDMVLDPSGFQAIDRALEAAIGKWTFEPVVKDGHPVTAKTRMDLRLSLEPVESGYRLRVRSVHFGGVQRLKHMMRPPRYPQDAARIGLGAKVTLVLQLRPDGSVDRVHAEQASLDKRTPNEKVAERWRRLFEQSSAAAARTWHFEGLEEVDGQAVAASVRVPVEYVMGSDAETANKWHGFIPGPYRPAPWVQAGAVAQEELDLLRDGQAQALDSRVRLHGDVVGTLL